MTAGLPLPRLALKGEPMMDDDKLIAFLLDALENAYVENAMLRTMIMTYRDHLPEIGDWEKQLERLKAQDQGDVRTKFAPFRDAVARSRDVEQTLSRFLKDTPPKGGVQ